MKYKFTILLSLIVIVLSVIPIPEVKPLEIVPLWDKWVHFVMYGSVVFAMWLDKWLMQRSTTPEPSPVFIVTTYTYPALLGGAMELVQAYCTTCRSGDYYDFLADLLGIYITELIIFIIWKVVKTSEAK